jgi:prepilin-type processing-associated H-X9-DG protein
MKQLALGNIMYAGDNKEQFPSGSNWCDAVEKYIRNEKTYLCPGGDPAKRCHYALNTQLSGLATTNVTAPAETVLLFEFEGGWNRSGGPEMVLKKPRHRKAIGLVFADGHAEIAGESRLLTVRWEP